MESSIEKIQELLLKKSSTKQKVFRQTKNEFENLKVIAAQIAETLNKSIAQTDQNVEVVFFDKGEFEFHLKFSGDVLVYMMHTNVFNFEPNHYIHNTDYVKEDTLREFCGMIQVYNFLSDSIKYNRENDLGYLIARIFINKDNHFFMEGKRQLALKYNNFECCIIDKQTLKDVVIQAMHFCLDFDLIAPPLDIANYLTVEQKNLMHFSSGMPTGKRLGFTMHTNKEVE